LEEIRMSMRKKVILAAVLSFLMVWAMAGCGGAEGNDGDTNVNKLPLEGDLTSIIEEIYEVIGFDLPVGNMEVDLSNNELVKFNMGLDDGSKIKEAVMSEAMSGSQAYSLVLARVNNKEDAEDVAEDMINGIDQRKWICVEADDLQVVTYGDAVLLVMIDSNLEEVTTSEEIVKAFGEICGGEFDAAFSK
jgi:hypothetical protein